MLPVFLLVIDQDVTPETAMRYPELYKDLTKVCIEKYSVAIYQVKTQYLQI